MVTPLDLRDDPLHVISRPLVRRAAARWFAGRRSWYRWRYPSVEIDDGVVLAGRLRVRDGTRLSLRPGCVLRQSVLVEGGGSVSVGAHTRINGDCWIYARAEVSFGQRCLVSDCSVVDSDFHNTDPGRRHLPLGPEGTRPVRIGDNVWIGTRAMVLKGTTIRAGAVVGAAAVVRDDVPAGAVVVGNPAVVVRTFPTADLEDP